MLYNVPFIICHPEIPSYTYRKYSIICRLNSLRPSDAYMQLTIIGSDNGLSPGRRKAIIQADAGILLFGPLGTIFTEI